MTSQGIENLFSISAATRYNTERRPLLRGYFSSTLQSGEIFESQVSDTSISDYWENEGLAIENWREESLSADIPQKVFRHLLLMYPDDPDRQHYQMYLNVRYSDISEQIREAVGYSAVDLTSFEALIYNLIAERAEALGIGSAHHTFEEKENYVEATEYEQPSVAFQNKWISCIEFTQSNLIDVFLDETKNQPLTDELSISHRIDSVYDMIDFLSVAYEENEEYSRHQFLSTPLFKKEGKEDRIIVPFPSLLVNTAQMRIEELFQQYEKIRNIEDHKKGDLVEELALDALSEFNSRNLVRSFKYTDPHPREIDGLLLFEDSFWSIEIKSHPIFRKAPNNIPVAMARFEDKTKEAIQQGENALNFLKEQGDEVLYHLTGEKSLSNKEYGTIIVLDGLLPTLFSQNERIDQIFGMEGIYQAVEAEDRILLITLFDLFELANQIEELNRLEDYLLWRTNFGFDMPVFSFNERDYWSMYFDNYDSNQAFQEVIDDAAEKESIITYISNRFNDKPHLPDDGFDQN